MSAPFIREARADELHKLPEIERSAAALFEGEGHDMDILTNVTPGEVWAPRQAAGTVWVADDGAGEAVGFLAAEVFKDELHVWELDVRQEAQGQGIGRRLMNHAIDWARGRGLARVTLTTFRDIPWNAPFYASLGFAAVAAEDLSVRLAEVLSLETSKGLNPDERCAMVLELRGGARSHRMGGA
ncbi:GNAT family N-acetyltransferase [Phenylobacterium sp.]|jgi:GNAT superfamily N-acetyltransferase|uniref:GNAT family N-acetyltransferase n=1 Tax=Phenylobacterium sp. TaxID=1871053 RepID=UPI002E33DBEB|nr:GNAT family N-acetyltransferase [Phenylobacterium sp.]HEX2561259.1 GNAT family N-acetyltransferase [Phenylobacterium sp.]